jgi:Skp family chaperone for outer membrane proteins
MNVRLFVSALALCSFVGAGAALAHEPTNLKVIAKDIKEKELESGMKAFNKGLGTKCEACHVKGKKPSDDGNPAKEAGRTFLRAAIGEKDEAKRKAALETLLKELKLERAKNEKQVWEGIDKFRK